MPSPVLASFRKFSHPQPYLVTQNKRYTREPRGSRLLLTRKSSNPMISLPRMVKSLNMVIPKIQGRDNRNMAIPFMSAAFFTLQFHRSCAKDMIFWNTAIMVESAAKDMNRKNSAPQNLPPFMALNTLGRVTNTRPGPYPGLTLKAEHAGKMISPAMSATMVSRIVMLTASPVSLCSLPI